MAVSFATATVSAPSGATTPPKPLPFEQIVCRATHVFIGTARNLRIVRTEFDQPYCQKFEDSTLSLCEAVEVDVVVDDVLYPSAWKPNRPVKFQFGGGQFSVAALRSDLDGKSLLFHVVESNRNKGVFITSYGWSLAAPPDSKDKVTKILGECVR